MSKCFSCGQTVESGEYRDKSGKYWCDECRERILSQWADLEKLEDKAEMADSYRAGLIKAIDIMTDDDLCVEPNKRCTASAEECQECWLNYLIGMSDTP